MARWNMDADAQQETEGSSGGGNFTPAPRGIYTIQVANVKPGVTQTKRQMVTLECEIADEGDEFGKKVWHNVTQIPKGEKGHGIMVHSLHAFGLEHDGHLDFDPVEAFQGQSARALLGVKPYTKVKDGRSYTNDVNFVEALYSPNHPEPSELPTATQPHAQSSAKKSAEPVQQELEEVPF